MFKVILSIATVALCVTKCCAEFPAKTRATPNNRNKFTATDAEIIAVSEEMFAKASMTLANKVKLDTKSSPIFVVPEAELNKIETVRSMRALFDNYAIGGDIVTTPEHKKEQDKFLDAVLKTKVMDILFTFFAKKGVKKVMLVNGQWSPKLAKNFLEFLWFMPYARVSRGPKESCGFRHVFEHDVIRQGEKTVISGLHNWIYFRDAEMSKEHRIKIENILISGKHPWQYVKASDKIEIIDCDFTMDFTEKVGGQKLEKPKSSMFLGTLPELEMALYTLCIMMKNKEKCIVSLGRKKFEIDTYAFDRGDNQMVASSYPVRTL